jgi:putative ABC exporter
VIDALWFLSRRTFVNAARRKLAQIRNPRYAVAVLIGIAYLVALVSNHHGAPRAGSPGASALGQHRELLAAVGIALAVAWAWLYGTGTAGLAFSQAEVVFLFTAPIRRSSLIQFKLFRAQGRLAWTVVIWAIIFSPAGFGLPTLLRAGALWALATTLYLHQVGASLVRTSLAEHGSAGLRRRLPSLVLLTLALVLVSIVLVNDLPLLAEAARHGAAALLAAVDQAASRPAPALLLFPFRLLARPITARDTSAWLAAIWPVLLVMVAHYVWVIRSDTAFEETAAEASTRRAARLSARRTGAPNPGASVRGYSPPIFRLAPTGWPAMAILWKNLIQVVRSRRARAILLVVLVACAAAAIASVNHAASVTLIGTLAATWGGLSLLMGPQWIRNDLRTDLARLELLRSFPVRGAEIVAAEAAAAAAVLTCVQWMFAVFAYCAYLGATLPGFTLATRTIGLAAALLALPAVNFAGFLIQNGAALAYPAWVRVGPARAAGIETLGQNVLSMLVYAIALLLMLALPLGAAAGLGLLLRPFLHWLALVPAMLAGLALLGAECFVLVRALGALFERLDISPIGQTSS